MQETAFKLRLVPLPPETIPIVPYKTQEMIGITLDRIVKIEKKDVPDPRDKKYSEEAAFVTYREEDGTTTTHRVNYLVMKWLQLLRVPAEKFILNQDESE